MILNENEGEIIFLIGAHQIVAFRSGNSHKLQRLLLVNIKHGFFCFENNVLNVGYDMVDELFFAGVKVLLYYLVFAVDYYIAIDIFFVLNSL